MKYIVFLSLMFFIFPHADLDSRIIIVDCEGGGDYLTIQEGIDAAFSGDTVLVASGVYYENVFIESKAIHLQSIAGPDSTIIDAQEWGTSLKLLNIEENRAIFDGFAVINAYYSGIFIYNSNVLICNNIIESNHLHEEESSLTIITYKNPDLVITIKNNIIRNNIGSGWASGIYLESESHCIISNNLFYNNIGACVVFSVSIEPAPLIINNTIDSNSGHGIGTLILEGIQLEIVNNIITNNTGGGIVAYEPLTNQYNSYIENSYNCVWNNKQGNFVPPVSPGPGDISEDPLFVDPENSDYHLQPDSPCIDAGDPRLRDPDLSRSDMGCYFYRHSPILWEQRER
jgi:parallel beta-helix repeat protein